MSETRFNHLLQRWTLGLVRQLGEIVHVCAIYLGIAVLVTLAVAIVLPPVRDQVSQAYVATLYALTPDGVSVTGDAGARRLRAPSGLDAYRGRFPDYLDYGGMTAPALPQDSASVEGQAAIDPGLQRLQADFERVLLEHPDDLPVAGVSPAQFQALRGYLARKYRIAQNVAGALIHTVFMVGRQRGVDPQLLLAIIAIESRYNPFAESHVGAQGLMQVMTRVHRDKFQALGKGMAAALDPVANIVVGTQIYVDCQRRRGSIQGGLACYVGATGPSDGGYGAKVLAERRRIALASGITPARE